MREHELTLTALFRVRESEERRFLEAARAVVPATRAEPGCVEYRLHRHDERPGTFVFYEIWRRDEDHAQHLETPHIGVFLNAVRPLLVDEITVERWRAVER